MKHHILHGIGIAISSLVFLAGCACIVWPFAATKVQEFQTEQVIERFQEIALSAETEDAEPSNQALLSDMEQYNQRIYEEGQSGLCDAWSYQRPSFDLTAYGLETDLFGYIEIPAMDSKLPIYLGATSENMRKGAVHLSQTSLPIGGENTNCVLAAHRGYRGIPFWRDIEKIAIGDEVLVTNLWGQLTYQVTEIQIIYPNETDQILIQEGRDMLTLITCHPYGGHGKYRYVVYCERVTEEREQEIQETPTLLLPTNEVFISSEKQIQREETLQKAGFVLMGVLFLGGSINLLCKRRKRR
jgi:sortase A